MNELFDSVLSLIDRISPAISWILFFIIVFALIGLAVRFYMFFDNSNYTYYKPSEDDPYALKDQELKKQIAEKKESQEPKNKSKEDNKKK